MKILIACEFSGIVRAAFVARGHEAWSCDLLPSERRGNHIQDDVRKVLNGGGQWDMLIAHPECTHLAVSGARYFAEKRADGRQQAAIEFFMEMINADIPRIAVENPVCIMSTIYRKPDQIIQPYQFGHSESKKTCLWLKGLPLLTPTKLVEPTYHTNPDGTIYTDSKGAKYSETHFRTFSDKYKRWDNQTPSGQNKLSPGPERWKIRSRTYTGIAEAMAKQWGSL